MIVDSNRDSIFAQNEDGDTPLDCAYQNGHDDVVNYLLDRYEETVFEREDRHVHPLDPSRGNLLQ